VDPIILASTVEESVNCNHEKTIGLLVSSGVGYKKKTFYRNQQKMEADRNGRHREYDKKN